jgi:hypothetical protein
MHILFSIGMQMMVSMFGCPPQHAFLSTALCQERKNELKDPACRVSSMREIPYDIQR